MRNIARRTAAGSVLSVLLAMAGLAGCKAPLPEVLKVGVVTTLSGPFVGRGKDILDGAELAADVLNKSQYKIDGKPVRIEVVSADDKGDAEAAKLAAQKLLDQNVHAIIGPILTPTTTAVVKMIAATGTPHLFTTTSTGLVAMGSGNTFRLLAHDDLQGRAMGVFAHETLHGSRIATLTEAGDYGRGLEKMVLASLNKAGLKPLVSAEIDPKSEVTADFANRIKAEHCDVIILLARELQLRSLFKTLDEVGYRDVVVLGSNAVRTKNSAKVPVTVRAFYATATAIDPEEFPVGRQFVTSFEEKFKAPPVWGAHYAYDAMFAIADAARRGRSVQAADMVAKLKTIDPLTPVNQQMRFNKEGEQLHASIGVYKVERGIWVAQMRSSIW